MGKAPFILSEIPQGRIWISPLSPGCATSEIGHTITLFCNAPGISPKVYEWSKGGQLVSNKSVNGVFNLSISSSKDFGLYTCNAISLYGVTTFNISVCSSSSDAVTASTGMQTSNDLSCRRNCTRVRRWVILYL